LLGDENIRILTIICRHAGSYIDGPLKKPKPIHNAMLSATNTVASSQRVQ